MVESLFAITTKVTAMAKSTYQPSEKDIIIRAHVKMNNNNLSIMITGYVDPKISDVSLGRRAGESLYYILSMKDLSSPYLGEQHINNRAKI